MGEGVTPRRVGHGIAQVVHVITVEAAPREFEPVMRRRSFGWHGNLLLQVFEFTTPWSGFSVCIPTGFYQRAGIEHTENDRFQASMDEDSWCNCGFPHGANRRGYVEKIHQPFASG